MDEYSLFAFDPGYGGGIDWGSIINRGIDVACGYLTRSPYYSPDDPRYQQRQPAVMYPTQPGANGQVRAGYDGGGAGINLSTNTLMLIGGAILIWMVASRRR